MWGNDKKIEKEEEQDLRSIAHSLRQIAKILGKLTKENNSLVLGIPNQQGEIDMGQPVTLTLGNGPVQATVQEFLQGVPAADTGPIAFSSDTPANVTVDPASGLVTPVAAGTATITATDSTNVPPLSDTVLVTVVTGPPPPPPQNDQLTLTIPSN